MGVAQYWWQWPRIDGQGVVSVVSMYARWLGVVGVSISLGISAGAAHREEEEFLVGGGVLRSLGICAGAAHRSLWLESVSDMSLGTWHGAAHSSLESESSGSIGSWVVAFQGVGGVALTDSMGGVGVGGAVGGVSAGVLIVGGVVTAVVVAAVAVTIVFFCLRCRSLVCLAAFRRFITCRRFCLSSVVGVDGVVEVRGRCGVVVHSVMVSLDKLLGSWDCGGVVVVAVSSWWCR